MPAIPHIFFYSFGRTLRVLAVERDLTGCDLRLSLSRLCRERVPGFVLDREQGKTSLGF
jgi:hypothetical protein